MEENFFIKRTTFTKTQPLKDCKLENLWVICFETGDELIRVSSFFKNIEYFYNIKEFQYYFNGLMNADFYEKTDEFIKVENNNLQFDFDIDSNDASNLVFIEDDEGNNDTMDWSCQVLHDEGSNDTTITRDYGLYFRTINENKMNTYKRIRNAKYEPVKVKQEKHPLNKSVKDTYINVYPRNNLEQLKWTILHPHRCKYEYPI